LQPGKVTLTGRERPLSIRVRYCGGCNPEIDRGSLVSRLRSVITEAGGRVVFCENDDADWLLLVNGCPRACLEEEFSEELAARQCICVEGAHLDHSPVTETALAEAIWERIKRSDRRLRNAHSK